LAARFRWFRHSALPRGRRPAVPKKELGGHLHLLLFPEEGVRPLAEGQLGTATRSVRSTSPGASNARRVADAGEPCWGWRGRPTPVGLLDRGRDPSAWAGRRTGHDPSTPGPGGALGGPTVPSGGTAVPPLGLFFVRDHQQLWLLGRVMGGLFARPLVAHFRRTHERAVRKQASFVAPVDDNPPWGIEQTGHRGETVSPALRPRVEHPPLPRSMRSLT